MYEEPNKKNDNFSKLISDNKVTETERRNALISSIHLLYAKSTAICLNIKRSNLILMTYLESL